MSNHLSHDQMSRWILGQCSLEEEEHGRLCPECSAELARFREAVSTFQSVMKDWSEREVVPRVEEIPGVLSGPHWLFGPSLRWALVGVTAAVLVAIPIYRRQDSPGAGAVSTASFPAATETNEDVLLMEQVTAHISRSLPVPMERVMALFPSEDPSMKANEVEPRDKPEESVP